MHERSKSLGTKTDIRAVVADEKKRAIVAAHRAVRRLRDYPRHHRAVVALERQGR